MFAFFVQIFAEPLLSRFCHSQVTDFFDQPSMSILETKFADVCSRSQTMCPQVQNKTGRRKLAGVPQWGSSPLRSPFRSPPPCGRRSPGSRLLCRRWVLEPGPFLVPRAPHPPFGRGRDQSVTPPRRDWVNGPPSQGLYPPVPLGPPAEGCKFSGLGRWTS